MIFTILAGAGKGRRINYGIPKSFIKIYNKELFLYTVEKFSKYTDYIYLSLPPKYLKEAENLIKNYKNVYIIKGGKERYNSVFNCLQKIKDDGIVLIHDVARPFVSEKLIKRVIEGTKKFGACIPVVKIVDTIKEIEGKFVKKTLDREKIYIVQTPQGFEIKLLKLAYEMGLKDKIKGSDDSFFVEKFNLGKIYCVEGERTNIKITFPEDIYYAEFILKKLK